jgi:hypothetical protein
MMMRTRHLSERGLEAQERRAREDAASRLLREVPSLTSLRLEMSEGRVVSQSAAYARTIVVERAPALFEFGCTDPSCRGGGHDLTWTILPALRKSLFTFEGEDVCRGSVGSAECSSVLRFHAIAAYRAPAP